jgi:hypothetical protein
MPITYIIIMEKTRSIFSYVQESSEESKAEVFGASRGRFARFKCRRNLHSLKVCGEAVSVDHQAQR